MKVKLETINSYLGRIGLILIIHHEGDHQEDGAFRFKEDGLTTISLRRRRSFSRECHALFPATDGPSQLPEVMSSEEVHRLIKVLDGGNEPFETE